MRGMERVYRRLYEKGLWGDERCMGLEVLGGSKAGCEGATDEIRRGRGLLTEDVRTGAEGGR
jgi:hypothetical protein